MLNFTVGVDAMPVFSDSFSSQSCRGSVEAVPGFHVSNEVT